MTYAKELLADRDLMLRALDYQAQVIDRLSEELARHDKMAIRLIGLMEEDQHVIGPR